MNTSESIINISKALVEAQKEIKHAQKDRTNPHFKNEYATLESVIDATKDSLLKNGVNVIQSIDDKKLTTRLMHISGEFIESSFELILERSSMQGLGSAITYARRYSLAAMLNISQSDDDGNAAEPQHTKKSKKDEFIFPGGRFQGQLFSDIMPEDFDAELAKYEGVENKTANLLDLIRRMKLFKQQHKQG